MEGIFVDAVLDEVVPETGKAVVPVVSFFVTDVLQEVHEGEVHDGLEFGFLLCEVAAFLPGGDAYVVVYPCLADDVVAGVFEVHALVPAGHGGYVAVGVGVLTDAVDACVLCPPEGALDEVVHDEGIALVEVGHLAREPSVRGNEAVGGGGVGVDEGAELVVGLEVLAVVVEPVVGGEVAEEEVLRAAVVEDEVHDELDAVTVAVVDVLTEQLVSAEARVYLVVVGDGVSVVAAVGHVVDLDGCGPYGSDAEILEVVELLVHAGDIATVASEWLVAAYLLVFEAEAVVVGGVAIGETVGHEEVEDVGGVEIAEALGGALAEFVGDVEHLLAVAEVNVEGLGLCSVCVDVEDEVVGVLEALYAQELDVVGAEGDFALADVLAVEEYLQLGVLHVYPPVEGVYVFDTDGGLRCCLGGGGGLGCECCAAKYGSADGGEESFHRKRGLLFVLFIVGGFFDGVDEGLAEAVDAFPNADEEVVDEAPEVTAGNDDALPDVAEAYDDVAADESGEGFREGPNVAGGSEGVAFEFFTAVDLGYSADGHDGEEGDDDADEGVENPEPLALLAVNDGVAAYHLPGEAVDAYLEHADELEGEEVPAEDVEGVFANEEEGATDGIGGLGGFRLVGVADAVKVVGGVLDETEAEDGAEGKEEDGAGILGVERHGGCREGYDEGEACGADGHRRCGHAAKEANGVVGAFDDGVGEACHSLAAFAGVLGDVEADGDVDGAR